MSGEGENSRRNRQVTHSLQRGHSGEHSAPQPLSHPVHPVLNHYIPSRLPEKASHANLNYAPHAPQPLRPHPSPTTGPPLSSRAQSRDLLCAFLLPQISTELQHRTRRRTIFSRMAGESLLAAERLLSETHVPLPIRCWSSVKICGGRKAQSRSLDCARDDKRGRWKGKVGGGENSRRKGKSRTTFNDAPGNKAPPSHYAHTPPQPPDPPVSSLDCARDDKLGVSDIGRQCLRREANTGGSRIRMSLKRHTRRSANPTT